VSVERPDPDGDAAAVREATRLLIDTVSTLPPAATAEPSLLRGWTRGHLLAHLARNADALTNLRPPQRPARLGQRPQQRRRPHHPARPAAAHPAATKLTP
jgi:uncharacterized protein (TIGR03083 family)